MSFFEELKRRNVFKVAAAYLLVGWLIMQISDVMVPTLRLPEWVQTATAYFLIIGFLPAIVFAWAFELTPEGLRRETAATADSPPDHAGGQKLNYIIIGALVIVVAILLLDRYWNKPDDAPPAAPATVATPAEDQVKSVAVLPFSNLSSDEENAFFAAGVHEDILTHLSRISDLHVNSRTSVMQYAETELNMKDVARELGARYILEGSVRRSGNRVRVTAQLVDAENDVHLWADNFDRELTDIFAIQTAVAREISNALQAELSPVEQNLISGRPTDSIEAYDLFLQARAVMQDAGQQSSTFSDRAIGLLEQAIEIDPEYAQAWALLAVAHGDYYWFRIDPTPGRLDKMKRAVDRAFELQPDMPEARLALANYHYRGFYDYPKALEELERVRTVLPNDTIVLHLLGLTYRRLGDYQKSIDTFMQAVQIDPAHEQAWGNALETASEGNQLAGAIWIREALGERFSESARIVAELAKIELLLFGDTKKSQEILDAIPDIQQYYLMEMRFMTAYWARDYTRAAEYARREGYMEILARGAGVHRAAQALMAGGFNEEAQPLLEEAAQLLAASVDLPQFDNYPWPHAIYAQHLVMSGQAEESLGRCNRAKEILPIERDKIHGPQIAHACAWVTAMAGHTEEALDEIERLLEIGFHMNYWHLALSPDWDFMRDHPRFQQIVADAKREMEALFREAGLEP